jgi:hypothetical protein
MGLGHSGGIAENGLWGILEYSRFRGGIRMNNKFERLMASVVEQRIIIEKLIPEFSLEELLRLLRSLENTESIISGEAQFREETKYGKYGG